MSETGQALLLSDHRIIPEQIEDHSVVRWRCIDCQAEQDCVSEYLADVCAPQL
jgi:hypothetical protein